MCIKFVTSAHWKEKSRFDFGAANNIVTLLSDEINSQMTNYRKVRSIATFCAGEARVRQYLRAFAAADDTNFIVALLYTSAQTITL